MRIDILTVLPELLEGPLNHSILKRAQNKGLVEIVVHNLRDFSTDKHRRVDDYPFGGSAGMVMQIEPIDRAISQLKSERDYDDVIYTSPDGEVFNQPIAISSHGKSPSAITSLPAANCPLQSCATLLCGLFPVLSVMSSRLSPTLSKTTYWPRPCIHVRPNIKVGGFPMYCYRDTNVK